MKAQLKNTQMVEIDLPEYFIYTRWSEVHFCRVIGEDIVDVCSRSIARSNAKYTLEELLKIEMSDFAAGTRAEFKAKIHDVTESFVADPPTNLSR